MAMRQYDDDQTDDIMIQLVPELRRRIKIAAAQSNLSVQEYIERILEQTVPLHQAREERTRELEQR